MNNAILILYSTYAKSHTSRMYRFMNIEIALVFILNVICYTIVIFHCKEGNSMATKKAAVVTKKSAAKKKPIIKVTSVKATAPRAHTVSTVAAKAKRRIVISQVSAGAVVAEFVGTFIFAAAIIASQGSPVIVGFALIALVLAVNTLSSAHFNPCLLYT